MSKPRPKRKANRAPKKPSPQATLLDLHMRALQLIENARRSKTGITLAASEVIAYMAGFMKEDKKLHQNSPCPVQEVPNHRCGHLDCAGYDPVLD